MSGPARDGCPTWCIARHGDLLGEDDLVHCSAEFAVGHLVLRLCAGDGSGSRDGPFVLVNDNELTAREAESLIAALVELVGLAARSTHNSVGTG